MAGDKRIGDLAIGVLVGVFVLGIFTYAIIDMDNNTHNTELRNIYSENDYTSLTTLSSSGDVQVFNNLLGGNSSFVILPNQQIDTRGQGEANIMAQNKHSTISSFFNHTSLTKWDYNGLIIPFLLALIGIISGILFLRVALGTGRS
jgi:hypothetical protein